MINPKLKEGDRVVVLHMDDDINPIPMGTSGTVLKHSVVFGDDQYYIKWDNGSRLSLIDGIDMWDFEENYKNKRKKKINEMTSSSSGGRYRVPIVLAPQDWNEEQMGAFTIPVSKYLNADLAYDSYDNKMERSKKEIRQGERFTNKKIKMAKKMFSQNDEDGNPINGYIPDGSMEPGTPKEIKKIANLPKSENKPVIKNIGKETKLLKKSKMVESILEMNIDSFKKVTSGNNADVFKYFNAKFLRKYLLTLRDSGVTNMFGAAPYLYMGRERLEHEFKYKDIPNEEKFDELLDMSDQAQSEMVHGIIKYLEANGKEADLQQINRELRRFSQAVVQNYMLLF